MEDFILFFYLLLDFFSFNYEVYDLKSSPVDFLYQKDDDLVSHIKSMQELYDEALRDNPPKRKPADANNNTLYYRQIRKDPNLQEEAGQENLINMVDLRPLKEGESPRPEYDCHKELTVISKDGTVFVIPPLPYFESYEEIIKFRAETRDKATADFEILKVFRNETEPELLSELNRRIYYNSHKDLYLLIHKKY